MCERIPGIAALFLAAALTSCAAPPPPQPAAAAAPTVTVYVIDRGWHTDIALPEDELPRPLAPLARAFPGARYFVFGFGDRRYYMAREANFADLLLALFPSRGVLLVTALRVPPPAAFGVPNVIRLRIAPPGLARLDARLWRSFAPDRGAPVALGAGPYPGSAFYDSAETYDAVHTCNTWTAELLQAGGVPVAADVVFADQLMREARAAAAPR